MLSESELTSLQTLLDSCELHRLLGLRAVGADREAGWIVLRMPFTKAASRSDGAAQFHGGAMATFADVAGDFALIARLGFGVPTIDLRIDYLRAAKPPYIQATAQIRRAGKTLGVVDITIEDAEGQVVALGRGCYSTRAG
jgi:uncharacterized protein (TIGR00369 family)